MKKANDSQKCLFAMGALAAAIASMPSYAEEGARKALEEVVVTARKQEESIQDIPVAVSSFSQEDLKALNVSQTADLGAFTPSLNIAQPGGNSGTIAMVTIRGQVQTDNIMTLDTSVGWYLDDIYLARPQNTNTSMFDIDRVEILKGPQGTLYGRNTTGGTIKLVTTKADVSSGLNGFVVGGVGNYDQSKIGGAINIPVIPDVLAVRLSALKDKVGEGFQKVDVYDANPISPTNGQIIQRRKNGTADNSVYRLGVTYQPTDDLRVLLSYEENESEISMANGNTSPNPGAVIGVVMPAVFGIPYVAPSSDFMHVALNSPNVAWAKTKTASGTVEYDISDTLSTKLVYGWRDMDSWFDTDVDGVNQGFSTSIIPFQQSAIQNSVEWQLTGEAMDGGLDWVSGLYYFEEAGQDLSRSGGLANLFANPPTYYNISKTVVDKNRSRSAFFQGTLHLTDALNFTGGLRYTKDTKPILSTARGVTLANTLGACRFPAGSGLANEDDVACTWANKDSYEYISWTAGFDYKFSADLMTYLKASSANRSGGQNLRGLDVVTTKPFQPEKATDIELGLKGEFFNHTLQLNADYFHTFYTNVQQSNLIQTTSGLITQVVNQAKANIDGIEVESRWQATDSLQLAVSGSWMDWKFTDPNSILPRAPTEQYTVRADYTVPVSFGTWLFDVNYSWRGEILGNCSGGRTCVRDFAPETGDPVGLWGARFSLDIESLGLNVALWGRNLTDEQYVVPGLQLYFPTNGISLSNDAIGTPRTFGVEANYKF